MVYLPREDSHLLKKWVEKLANGTVLDIGTGSGIQAIAAAKKADKVIAVDLNPNIIKYLQKIEDKDLFYKDYGLKHPLALHNTSFNKIEEALRDFFKIYDNLRVKDFTPHEKGKQDN